MFPYPPPRARPPPSPTPHPTPPLRDDLAQSSLAAAAGYVSVRVDEQMMRVNEAATAGEQIPGRQVADGGGGGRQDKGSNGEECS